MAALPPLPNKLLMRSAICPLPASRHVGDAQKNLSRAK